VNAAKLFRAEVAAVRNPWQRAEAAAKLLKAWRNVPTSNFETVLETSTL